MDHDVTRVQARMCALGGLEGVEDIVDARIPIPVNRHLQALCVVA
jgi:hypothetical protein